MQRKFDGDGGEHGKRRTLCPPHAREARRERVQPRERRRRDGRKAQKAHEGLPLPRRQRRIQERDDGAREHKEPRGAWYGERERDEHGKHGAAARLLPLSTRTARRHRGHGRRHQPVAHRCGKGDERRGAPRKQPVQRDGALRMTGKQAHDDNAVEHLRERQQRRTRHDGQGGEQDAHVGGTPRDEPPVPPHDPLSAQAHGKENKRRKLGHGHPEERRTGGRDGIGEARGKKEPRARLYELFDDLGSRRREHIAPPLKISPQNGDERDEKDGRCQSKIAADEPAVPLPARYGGSEQAHEQRSQKTGQRKQAERRSGNAPLPPRRALRRHGAGERRGHARRRKREHETKERIRHLVKSQPVSAQKVCKRDAVYRSDRLCQEPARAHDRDVFEKDCMFHYVKRAAKKPLRRFPAPSRAAMRAAHPMMRRRTAFAQVKSHSAPAICRSRGFCRKVSRRVPYCCETAAAR